MEKNTYTNPSDLINGIISGDLDEEIRAYKAAHPEKAEQRKNMTREEKIDHLLNMLEKLGMVKEPTPEEIAAENEYKALEQLLSFQCFTDDIDRFYHNYIKRKKRAKYDECLLILDIFNYGKICGKREERARRKRGEQV